MGERKENHRLRFPHERNKQLAASIKKSIT
jgi:hypothetical protein